MAEFKDNEAASRFELLEAGAMVRADYRRAGDVVAITHVETPPALRGQGAAERLMDAVVANARAEGFKLRARCPYAAHYFETHSEAADVIAA